jgi:hypothetical protein
MLEKCAAPREAAHPSKADDRMPLRFYLQTLRAHAAQQLCMVTEHLCTCPVTPADHVFLEWS